jgi:hypothetical protein
MGRTEKKGSVTRNDETALSTSSAPPLTVRRACSLPPPLLHHHCPSLVTNMTVKSPEDPTRSRKVWYRRLFSLGSSSLSLLLTSSSLRPFSSLSHTLSPPHHTPLPTSRPSPSCVIVSSFSFPSSSLLTPVRRRNRCQPKCKLLVSSKLASLSRSVQLPSRPSPTLATFSSKS